MKRFILFFIVLSCVAKAEDVPQHSVELNGGGIGYHFSLMPNAGSMPNALTPNGSITYNPSLGVAYVMNHGVTYTTVTIFGGSNEIYSPTFGGTVSYGVHNRNFYFGAVGGGYLQNNAAVTNAGFTPVTLSNPNSSLGFTPILGVELNFRLYLYEKVYFKFNNLISPTTVNQTIGIGFDL